MAKLTESDEEATIRPRSSLAGAEHLIDRLHDEAEGHRQEMARAIHDDLGGLLVSVAMDLTLVQKRASEAQLTNLGPLDRGLRSLQSAIDLGRRMVEQLRPSILDNFGLFSALRWHLREASKGSSAQLTESFPATEPALQPSAVTALFRIAEEAINMIFKRHGVLTVDMHLDVVSGELVMRFAGDGIAELVDGVDVAAADALTSMQHRMRALGGRVELVHAEQRTILHAAVPLPSGGSAG